jgi:hypothetical protein
VILQPRLAFEALVAFDLPLAQWARGQATALGFAPPASARQGKAPEDRFIFIEQNDLAAARLVLQGSEVERGRDESCWVGIKAASGTIVAYVLFLIYRVHPHDRVGPRSGGPTPWPVRGNSTAKRGHHGAGSLDRQGG